MDCVLRRSYSCSSSQTRALDFHVRRVKDSPPYHEGNTAQVTSDLEMTLGHLLPVGNHHIASLGSCDMSVDQLLFARMILRVHHIQRTEPVDNVATQETSGTKDSRSVA